MADAGDLKSLPHNEGAGSSPASAICNDNYTVANRHKLSQLQWLWNFCFLFRLSFKTHFYHLKAG